MKYDPTTEFSGELTLDEQSSQRLLQLLKEQDQEFINELLDGECGITLNGTDGRSVDLVPKSWAREKHKLIYGEWIEFNDGLCLHRHKCSECGENALTNQITDPNGFSWDKEYLTRFCPHCGERMKRKESKDV